MYEIESELIKRAAAAIADAEALLITAGAGIGVDSGMPDFRGDEGFWKAYPPMRHLGISFVDMANPSWFARDSELAWGFYGHRLRLYRDTEPHPGYRLLRRWAAAKKNGLFVFTSNVDGQFQKAGFPVDRIAECHGSIHHLQCSQPCHDGIYPAAQDRVQVTVDEQTFRARQPLPVCPKCGAVARPNVLMFGDWSWLGQRSAAQDRRLEAWLQQIERGSLVVIEIGAGTAVPTVRFTSERVVGGLRGTLIRINPREPQVPAGQIGIAAPALATLQAIQAELPASG